ncbi:hypothetical protein, partial [Vibrio parahaemolyticus]|uniref:hypothetical protein n=1 Tax=Vibrio parahaemolyticus TaxID=670 RepID=UPI001C5FBE66
YPMPFSFIFSRKAASKYVAELFIEQCLYFIYSASMMINSRESYSCDFGLNILSCWRKTCLIH